jgi:hypothetical protein
MIGPCATFILSLIQILAILDITAGTTPNLSTVLGVCGLIARPVAVPLGKNVSTGDDDDGKKSSRQDLIFHKLLQQVECDSDYTSPPKVLRFACHDGAPAHRCRRTKSLRLPGQPFIG